MRVLQILVFTMLTKVLTLCILFYVSGVVVAGNNTTEDINEEELVKSLLKSANSDLLTDTLVNEDQIGNETESDPTKRQFKIQFEERNGFNYKNDRDYIMEKIIVRENSKMAKISRDSRSRSVKLQLRTRKNILKPQVFSYRQAIRKRFRDFNPRKRTYIVVHGITPVKNVSAKFFNLLVSTALLHKEDCNVLVVNWERLGNWQKTRTTYKNAMYVGKLISNVIKHFQKIYETRKYKPRYRDFHLIGHQIGSIVVASAGQETKGKLGRIIAFDPMSLKKKYTNSKMHVNKKHAQMVQAIHTSSCTKKSGHIDFYPNGGSKPQPGCIFDPQSFCSTRRSFEFYVLSCFFNKKDYIATKCGSFKDYKKGKCKRNPVLSLCNNAIKVTRRIQGKYYLQANISP